MTLEETIRYIDSYHQNKTTPGLSRIRGVMERLGRPHGALRFVHVAGTNGKGSTCAMLESILRRAGYRTGLFTSPHLLHFRERIRCGGVCISDEEIVDLAARVAVAAEASEEPLSEFEFITAMGLCYFAQKNCDVVILEVGLGGEFDATNVIERAECSVITNLGRDHMALLGESVEEIAAAKAGIVKKGCPVVLYPNEPSVEAVVRERCARLDAPLHTADFTRLVPQCSTLDGQRFHFGPWRELELPLPGAFQQKNGAVALTAVEVLREQGWEISDEAVRSGLAQVRWPGRLQCLSRQPLFLLDGGHNSQGVDALAQELERLLPGTPLIFLLGILSDKDAAAMTGRLCELATEFVAVEPESERAVAAEKLGELLGGRCPVHLSADIPQAVELACSRALAVGGAVCCTGSLYLAGAVLRCFAGEAFFSDAASSGSGGTR